MIKLKIENLEKLEDDYCNKMFQGIISRYNDQKLKGILRINPFTGKDYMELFEDKKGNCDIQLIKALLCKPIISKKYNFKQVNCYISTAKLVFYSKFSVDKILKKKGGGYKCE